MTYLYVCNKEFGVSFLIPLEGSFCLVTSLLKSGQWLPILLRLKIKGPQLVYEAQQGSGPIMSSLPHHLPFLFLTSSLIALSSPPCLLHLSLCMCCFSAWNTFLPDTHVILSLLLDFT